MAKTLQTSPVDPKVEAARQARAAAYAIRHVQTKAEQREALAQAQAQARSPDQAQQAAGALLSGSKFYISWTISTERRRELRQLIQSNGGEVLKEMKRGAVELVENNSLKTGQTWVSVDFVYDLVRDQTLPDITQYMAESWQTTASELSPGIPNEPKPRGRMAYTVEDDVKIFQFVNVTAHPAESMRERYRKVLTKYTPQERRNIMKHAKDADDARQRRELAAINAKPEASATIDTTVSPATEKKITPEVVVAGAQVSEVTTAEPHVVEEGNNVSTSESNAFEEKCSPPVAEADAEAKENGEEEEDEEIHGRGKKQARKSAAAAAVAQQKSVSPTQKETPRKETVADAEDSQEPLAAEIADTTAAVQSEPTDDVGGGSSSSSKENEEKPQVPSKKQQKQKLKRNVASPQREKDEPSAKTTELTEPTTAGNTRKKTSNSIPLATPPSREVGTAGIFFRSRWEQLINDTSNRQQLQQYFNLTRSREAHTAPAPAVGGKNLQKLTPGVRVVVSTPSQVNKSDDEMAATTSSSAATTTRRRKRTEDPASTAEEEEKEETATLSAKPAPSKKQKVRPISQPRKAAGAPLPAAVAVAATPQVEEQEEVIVTSESEVDSLTCQLQFATNQELNTVTHALYYSSGDVGVALSFLQGACPADFWSEEDDLLLTDLMSDATDARKVTDARRRGAFINMRVRRTAAQILARIRYLL